MCRLKSSNVRLPITSETERRASGALRSRFGARWHLMSSEVHRRSEACTFGCEMSRYRFVGQASSMALAERRTCELLCSWLLLTKEGLSMLLENRARLG